jgi:hypothetical protein
VGAGSDAGRYKEGSLMEVKRSSIEKERLIWTIVVILLVLSIVILFMRSQAAETEAERAQEEAFQQRLRADSLANVAAGPVARGDEEDRPTQISGEGHTILASEIRYLQRLGLDSPVEDLIADLRSSPRLIGAEAVLGGTMGFHDRDAIRVLNDRWAFARYDDGHIMGAMLLRYTVSAGEVTWEVIAEAEP